MINFYKKISTKCLRFKMAAMRIFMGIFPFYTWKRD